MSTSAIPVSGGSLSSTHGLHWYASSPCCFLSPMFLAFLGKNIYSIFSGAKCLIYLFIYFQFCYNYALFLEKMELEAYLIFWSITCPHILYVFLGVFWVYWSCFPTCPLPSGKINPLWLFSFYWSHPHSQRSRWWDGRIVRILSNSFHSRYNTGHRMPENFLLVFVCNLVTLVQLLSLLIYLEKQQRSEAFMGEEYCFYRCLYLLKSISQNTILPYLVLYIHSAHI